MTQPTHAQPSSIERYSINEILYHVADPFDLHPDLSETEISAIRGFLEEKLRSVKDNLTAIRGTILKIDRSNESMAFHGPIKDEYEKLETILYNANSGLLNLIIADPGVDKKRFSVRKGIVQFPKMHKEISRLGKKAQKLISTYRRTAKDEGNLAALKKYGVDGHMYVQNLRNDRTQFIFERTKLLGRTVRKFADLALEEMIYLDKNEKLQAENFRLEKASLGDIGGIQIVEPTEYLCEEIANNLISKLKKEYKIESKTITKDKEKCPGRIKLVVTSNHMYEEPIRIMISHIIPFLYDDYFGEAKRVIYCTRRENMDCLEFSDGTNRELSLEEKELRRKMLDRLGNILTIEDRKKMNPYSSK